MDTNIKTTATRSDAVRYAAEQVRIAAKGLTDDDETLDFFLGPEFHGTIRRIEGDGVDPPRYAYRHGADDDDVTFSGTEEDGNALETYLERHLPVGVEGYVIRP